MRVLITGIGGPTPKGIANSLRLSGRDFYIVGVDADIFAPGLYSGSPFDATYLVPNPDVDLKEYWKAIEHVVAKERVEFAFVVPETEVIRWSLRQLENRLPCKTVVPSYRIATFLFDKFGVAEFLHPHGCSPRTLNVEGSAECIQDVERALGYPYWVRRNSTAGAIGSFKIESQEDLEMWLQINKGSSDFIASTFLPGKNFACKLLYRNDELIMGAVGERIDYLLSRAVPSGISGMCARGRLRNRIDVFEVADSSVRRIFSHFQEPLTGMYTVDLKEDAVGNPMITEINIRHVSFTYAFSLGGANFPVVTLDSFLTGEIAAVGLIEFNEELIFVRGVDHELDVVKTEDLKNLSYLAGKEGS